MKLGKYLAIALPVVLGMTLVACGSAPTVKAEVVSGDILFMKASNFAFEPNAVTIHGPGTVTLTITNTGGTGHNITVNDPAGKVIASAEIPPNATVSTQVTFPALGDYPFVCNHPLHAGFGMKGHFFVTGS